MHSSNTNHTGPRKCRSLIFVVEGTQKMHLVAHYSIHKDLSHDAVALFSQAMTAFPRLMIGDDTHTWWCGVPSINHADRTHGDDCYFSISPKMTFLSETKETSTVVVRLQESCVRFLRDSTCFHWALKTGKSYTGTLSSYSDDSMNLELDDWEASLFLYLVHK